MELTVSKKVVTLLCDPLLQKNSNALLATWGVGKVMGKNRLLITSFRNTCIKQIA